MYAQFHIPMSSPDITQAEIHAVNAVLRTSHLGTGAQVAEFEKRMAAYTGMPHAIVVSSGTTGLHLCVIGAGISEGDLVITSPFSSIASANCILYERGIPVFVDVDPATGNIDPNMVAEAVRNFAHSASAARHWLPPLVRDSQPVARSLKAILPVHVFGQPADMDPITKIARQYDLAVIEDACEAIGAEYKSRKVGALCDAAVFSFGQDGQITTGEGGMIVTSREKWAALFRGLREQRHDVPNAWLSHAGLGHHCRMSEMGAALGLAQLQRIEELLTKRARVAQWFSERLVECRQIETLQIVPETTQMSWSAYVVRINPAIDRELVMNALCKAGIPSQPHFAPIHLQPLYREKFGYFEGCFPVAEELGRISLALPFSSVMTEMQVEYVCEHLIRAVTKAA